MYVHEVLISLVRAQTNSLLHPLTKLSAFKKQKVLCYEAQVASFEKNVISK